MRQRGHVIGALNLFRRSPGRMDDDESREAQALADIATLSVLTYEAVSGPAAAVGQMRNVLQSRMAVETAKGMVSATFDVPMPAALDLLRRHAVAKGIGLTALAMQLVDGEVDPSTLGV